MNFLEAVKSGKNFKRSEWETWYKEIVNYNSGIALTDKENNAIFLNKQDVLADDWVVKEDLAPCLFCDTNVEYWSEAGRQGIRCGNMFCTFEYTEGTGLSKEEFTKKWNNRVGGVRND